MCNHLSDCWWHFRATSYVSHMKLSKRLLCTPCSGKGILPQSSRLTGLVVSYSPFLLVSWLPLCSRSEFTLRKGRFMLLLSFLGVESWCILHNMWQDSLGWSKNPGLCHCVTVWMCHFSTSLYCSCILVFFQTLPFFRGKITQSSFQLNSVFWSFSMEAGRGGRGCVWYLQNSGSNPSSGWKYTSQEECLLCTNFWQKHLSL